MNESGCLRNPESAWEGVVTRPNEARALVEARLGTAPRRATVLPGGRGNLHVKLNGGRVLRVYQRDHAAAGKEAALLKIPWRNLRTPSVLLVGPDFLLLEWLELFPLRDTATHGRLVGAAAAEIHQRRFRVGGRLSEALEVVEPHPTALTYAATRFEALGAEWHDLKTPVLSALTRNEDRPEGAQLCLNHGDFKPSNLFLDRHGAIVVLDWEFAFSGPALMDVGQLFRWGTTEAFRSGFVESYRAGGGVLPSRWDRRAAVLDLVHLLSAATLGPGGRRNADIRRRITDTLRSLDVRRAGSGDEAWKGG